MKKQLKRGMTLLATLLLSTGALVPTQVTTAYASESEETSEEATEESSEETTEETSEESSEESSSESTEFDSAIFEQLLNEETAANQAMLAALPDFIEFIDTYQFHDMGTNNLDEATATAEQVEVEFTPDADLEIYEHENAETTFSYQYEVEDDVALLELSFSEGYLIYIDLLANTEVNEDEVNVATYEDIEAATSVEDLNQLDYTTLGIGGMNIDGFKPVVALPSTMPEELPEGLEGIAQDTGGLAESYLLFDNEGIRHSQAQNVDAYLENTIPGMVGLVQAYLDSIL